MLMRTAMLLSAALVATAAQAAAEDKPKYGAVEEKNVLSGKTVLDPRVGYIYMQGTIRAAATFLRVPDDETRAEYLKDWEIAFAKAQKKYPSEMLAWESQAKAAAVAQTKVPPKPQEPTRETFTIDAIELRDRVSFGPLYAFGKSDDRFAYLTAVKPGTYIYYGPVMIAQGAGASGYCNCMGTVRIEVKAGVVTDLGNSLTVLPQPQEPMDAGMKMALARLEALAARKGVPITLPATPPLTYGLPDSLKSWPSVKAELTANGKLNNYFGLVVSRIYPIPGVITYRRDRVIDAKAGAEIDDATIYTQVKIKR